MSIDAKKYKVKAYVRIGSKFVCNFIRTKNIKMRQKLGKIE